MAVLAPFVDKDADGFVSKDELADFLNHFGGVGAPSQAHQLDFSIQKVNLLPPLAHSYHPPFISAEAPRGRGLMMVAEHDPLHIGPCPL